MIATLLMDLNELARAATTANFKVTRLQALLKTDSFMILALNRFPSSRWGRRLPLSRWLVRRVLTATYGVELGKDVELGAGVFFVHSVGVVIGGNARVGARVRFYGNNTVGTARDDGYPVIEEDVQVGCGARVLGNIRVGARSIIGANAVVLEDVPPDSVVVGVPAHVVSRSIPVRSVPVQP
jgi:serine O-acetyltransferase